ncbi:hypothetical protein IFR08_10190 [Pseudomonas fluorescens]|uniref:phosphopantetheine-binding protein n=1 Tax=Pseudomonas fluorescens TaxID=294 RepID=UPI0010D0A46B|nr:phosphopantetheine-binding protein [Pseudomonas fluorescens]RYE72797.1 MAG: hypothetical protein EOO81_02440 [Oxalobacteraceae bacterium]MBD8099220.1 hypothetical protein [Pseudomonas fluorescens]MBD8774139.1 hypothetical protein [Pseudomonas fluorescens]MBD8780831.1 hypothetical protein [Pseudomonas fluorescens]MBD8796708.1 hypothetical protein [Pseudomonas fluorescens]
MQELNGGTQDTYERFLAVLQSFNQQGSQLLPDTYLTAIGIDSLTTISLLVELEVQLGIVIADEQLSADMFDTVQTLWNAIERQVL